MELKLQEDENLSEKFFNHIRGGLKKPKQREGLGLAIMLTQLSDRGLLNA